MPFEKTETHPSVEKKSEHSEAEEHLQEFLNIQKQIAQLSILGKNFWDDTTPIVSEKDFKDGVNGIKKLFLTIKDAVDTSKDPTVKLLMPYAKIEVKSAIMALLHRSDSLLRNNSSSLLLSIWFDVSHNQKMVDKYTTTVLEDEEALKSAKETPQNLRIITGNLARAKEALMLHSEIVTQQIDELLQEYGKQFP